MLNQCPGDAHSLFLPSGQLIAAPIFKTVETHPFEKAEGLPDVAWIELAANALPEPGTAECPTKDVLHDGQAPNKRMFLEDHPHL